MIGYRQDIDGLRAVAVLPVILFHADIPGVSGGFVGVDIFFVISGYLITSIIHREIGNGTFSILQFYERRARRILPALFAVIIATLAASYFFLMPTEFLNAAKSALAAVFFVSNILFWSETGYFSPGIYDQPLLHTWSLAIEEQFYIFFPPLMIILFKMRWGTAKAIGALTLLSFVLSALTTSHRPDMAYYLLPWRAWELGVGALIALGIQNFQISKKMREVLGLLGLAMVGYAIFGFDETTVFPGMAALLPVAGAGMIIACGGHDNTMSDKILSLAPVVWIGLISYSLYLWHWPVIVFYQQFTLDRPDAVGSFIVLAVSIVLAWLSWKYIEAPFRRPALRRAGGGRLARQSGVFGAALIGMLAISVLSVTVVRGDGWPWRLSDEAVHFANFTDDRHPKLRECTARFEMWRAPEDACIFGLADGLPNVAIWGDSHAAALLPEVEAAALRGGHSVAYLSRSGCLPILDTERLDGKTGRCVEYGDGAMDYILNMPSLETVIVVSRYAMAAKGYLVDYGLAERDWGPTIFSDINTGRWDEETRLDQLMMKVEESVKQMTQSGLRVVVVYPVPEIGHKVPETIAKLSLQGRSVTEFGLPRDLFDARNQEVIDRLDQITAQTGALQIRPYDILCNADFCRTVQNNAALYFDDDHLSSAGAALLGADLDRVMSRKQTDTKVLDDGLAQ